MSLRGLLLSVCTFVSSLCAVLVQSSVRFSLSVEFVYYLVVFVLKIN